jgi:hypothetical protein
MPSLNLPAWIGALGDGGSSAVFPFVGVLDHVAFYQTALPPERVLAHFDAHKATH